MAVKLDSILKHMLKYLIMNPETRTVKIMNALGDTTRFSMFKLMATEEGLCVGEIASRLNITASATSQHFRLFEAAGMVDKQRYGQKICYTVRQDDALINQIMSLLSIKEGVHA